MRGKRESVELDPGSEAAGVGGGRCRGVALGFGLRREGEERVDVFEEEGAFEERPGCSGEPAEAGAELLDGEGGDAGVGDGDAPAEHEPHSVEPVRSCLLRSAISGVKSAAPLVRSVFSDRCCCAIFLAALRSMSRRMIALSRFVFAVARVSSDAAHRSATRSVGSADLARPSWPRDPSLR